MTHDLECKEVIVTTLTRRGEGTKHSPVRRITQVFEKNGELIAERDPHDEKFIAIDMVRFTCWCLDNGIASIYITVDTVNKWLDSIEK